MLVESPSKVHPAGLQSFEVTDRCLCFFPNRTFGIITNDLGDILHGGPGCTAVSPLNKLIYTVSNMQINTQPPQIDVDKVRRCVFYSVSLV